MTRLEELKLELAEIEISSYTCLPEFDEYLGEIDVKGVMLSVANILLRVDSEHYKKLEGEYIDTVLRKELEDEIELLSNSEEETP